MRWAWILVLAGALAWSSLSPLQAQGTDKSFQEGKKLFEATCADCHRVNGQGLPAMFPALDKSSFVVGDPTKVIDTVLFGRKGRLGQMPSWKDTFNDQQVADVITYIRQSWANKGSAVTAEMVKKRRK
ncbi:MAG TPA: cytochrome c [Syntrophobacteria bacterium]|nr:cytochrome c [Syntrophobacteria bacterium]